MHRCGAAETSENEAVKIPCTEVMPIDKQHILKLSRKKIKASEVSSKRGT